MTKRYNHIQLKNCWKVYKIKYIQIIQMQNRNIIKYKNVKK